MGQCGDRCAVSVRRCDGIRDVRVLSDAGADAVNSPIRAAWSQRATTLLKMRASLLIAVLQHASVCANTCWSCPGPEQQARALLTQRAGALLLAEVHVCASLSMPPSSCVR